MLCVALTLVFSGVSLSGTINELQHAAGAASVHDHIMFGGLTIEQHADDDDHSLPANDAGSADHMPGHHHHSDAGSSIIPGNAQSPPALASNTELQIFEAQQLPSGLLILGPERPPKTMTLNA